MIDVINKQISKKEKTMAYMAAISATHSANNPVQIECSLGPACEENFDPLGCAPWNDSANTNSTGLSQIACSLGPACEEDFDPYGDELENVITESDIDLKVEEYVKCSMRQEEWNSELCMCVSKYTCRRGCPSDKILHPYDHCSCLTPEEFDWEFGNLCPGK